MGKGMSILLIFSATLGYGLMPIFTKIAYAASIRPIPLVFFRFTFATAILAGFFALRGWRRLVLPKATALRIAVHIGIPLTLTILSKFIAFTTMPMGVVQAIFFGYPLVVMIISIARRQEVFHLSNLLGYLIILSGIIFTLDFSDARITALGIVFSTMATVSYAWYILSIKHRSVMPVPSTVITTYVMATGSIIMALILPFSSDRILVFDPFGWWGIAGLVLISSIGSLILFNRGAKQVDSSLAAIICCFEPIVTIVFELIFLDGFYTPRQYIGIFLIPVGIMFSLTFARMRAGSRTIVQNHKKGGLS
jgi:drug/metabolite transporter (DMT)-like permease